MPIIKSAIKRMRQALKGRARNAASKRELREALKDFVANKASKSLSEAQSELDTAVKKNLISKQAASRKKAQLAKIAKEAGVTFDKTAKKPTTAQPVKKAVAKPKAKATTAKKPVAKKTAATPRAKKSA